jgi:hypothetical protein
MTRIHAGVLALAVLWGCGPADRNDNDSSDSDLPPGDHLEITPAQETLTASADAPASLAFTATLVTEDGERRDVTDETTFDVEVRFGDFDGNTFSTAGAGGVATITGNGPDQVAGETTLTIYMERVRVDPSAPANAQELFEGGADDPARAPAIAYPPEGVIMPLNIGTFETHWTDSSDSNVYEVSLVSEYTTLRVYVGDVPPNYAVFTPGEWAAVAGSVDQVTTQVRGRNSAGGGIGTSPPRAVALTNEDIAGGLYYWASSSPTGSGVFRHDLSEPEVAPEPYITAADSPNSCVGCHALSKAGDRMAVTWGGNGPATLFDVATKTNLLTTTQYWNFATYAPAGDVLATVSNGVMVLRDAELAGELTTIHSGGGWASHPDFAPDGSALAYTVADSGPWDFQVVGGDLLTRSYDAGTQTFGDAETLVSCPSDNCYYPAYSPDAQWVMFTRATGNSYDNPNSTLWVVPADGSAAPVELTSAIRPGETNSWTRWAPFPQTFGDAGEPMFWVTFSSKRAFGVRQAVGKPQVWMFPFFPERAAAGMDPVGVPFRLPFQDLASNNHIAQWTDEVIDVD